MENEAVTVMSPMLQYGFGFTSLILLAMLFFVLKWLLSEVQASREIREELLADTKLVIQNNTHAIEELAAKMSQQSTVMSDVRDKLLSRPCLLPQVRAQGTGISSRSETATLAPDS